MGSAGWRHKGDKGVVMEPRQLHRSPDEEYQKKLSFLTPGMFPNVIFPTGAVFYTCVLL